MEPISHSIFTSFYFFLLLSLYSINMLTRCLTSYEHQHGPYFLSNPDHFSLLDLAVCQNHQPAYVYLGGRWLVRGINKQGVIAAFAESICRGKERVIRRRGGWWTSAASIAYEKTQLHIGEEASSYLICRTNIYATDSGWRAWEANLWLSNCEDD